MGAILNGIVLHGSTPFGGTFLIFSDYMRPAVRLAALRTCRRSSSGPTTPSPSARTARRTSRSSSSRPSAPSRTSPSCVRDANEAGVVWLELLTRRGGPAGIALTRQNIPVFERGEGAASGDTFASAS